jgi:hypothetical protein
MWVYTVSLGNVARSTARTRYPRRASNIASGEPAQRAPTTIASNASVIAISPFPPNCAVAYDDEAADDVRRGGAEALRGNASICPEVGMGDFPHANAGNSADQTSLCR